MFLALHRAQCRRACIHFIFITFILAILQSGQRTKIFIYVTIRFYFSLCSPKNHIYKKLWKYYENRKSLCNIIIKIIFSLQVMSQNPWKKQAQVNKGPTAPGGGNVPPWMKNKVQQSHTQPVQPVQQPPVQPTTTPVTQTQPPPFVKPPGPGVNPPGGAPPGNAPPWMKNNPGTNPPPGVKPPGVGPTNVPGTNPPPGVKPPGPTVPATSGNVPPWMKNKAPGQSQSPIGTDRQQKQKQEEQARLKKQQQQEQKKRKQQQLVREQRERKRMMFEEQYSKLRQQQDKINQSKKKPNKKKNSPKKQEGKSPGRSSNKKLNLTMTPFHRYLLNLNSSCSKQQQYRQKIQYQKQFIENLSKFCQSARQGIINYMQQRKITQRKKNIINLQNIILQYGLVQGISGDSGNAYFRTRNIEFLQQKFSYYQIMFNLIVRLLKKLNLFRLRIPLVCRISYKGIQFLCEGICDELLDSVSSPAQNFIQIHGQLTQLQKQLKQSGYEFLNRKVFSVKKVVIDGSEFYILYLNDSMSNYIGPESVVGSRLSFFPNNPLNFEDLINLSLISSHSLGLTYCLMKQFSENKRNVTQVFKQAYLNLFQLAHAIRVVYASCQGQLEQKSFWNLVFQQNNQIWVMIKRAYEGIYGQIKNQVQFKLKNKFMLAKILQLMISVKFGVGKQKIDKQNGIYRKVPIFLQYQPHVTTLPLDSLQYYEITQLLQKNIQNPFKIRTAQQSNTAQQEILEKSDEIFMRKIIVFTNKAKVLFKKGLANKNYQMVRDAIKMIEQYEFKKGKQIEKLIIYPLLMTFYMATGQIPIQQAQAPKQQEPKQEHKEKDIEKQTQSRRYDKSKVESDVQDVQKQKNKKNNNDQQNLQKAKQQQQQQKQKINQKDKQGQKEKQVDHQTKMLKTFNNLLQYISELFQDQNQIWYHATLYTILASYYSRVKVESIEEDIKNSQNIEQSQIRQFSPTMKQQSKIPTRTKMFSNSHALDNSSKKNLQKQNAKNRLNESRAQSQPFIQKDPQNPILNKHPYYKQCLKFLELSHNICLQFYGSHHSFMAEFLLHQAEIFYNVNELNKAEISIQQALKVYKSSSKHARNILSCSMILGKSMIERGISEKDQKIFQNGIDILQKSAEQLLILGKDLQVIQIYDYLYKNLQSFGKPSFSKQSSPKKNEIQFIQQSSKLIKMDYYLQKMTQISLNSRNIQTLKQILKKSIKSQLNLYSKQRAVALKDLYDDYVKQQVPEDEDQNDYVERIQQLVCDLQCQKLNFGGFIEMIRWSLGILKSKGDNLQWERASEIMKKILGLFSEKQAIQLLV